MGRMYIYLWVNKTTSLSPSLDSWLIRDKYPKMAVHFRFEKCINLPIYIYIHPVGGLEHEFYFSIY